MTAATAKFVDLPLAAPASDGWAPPKGGRFVFAHPALRKQGTHFARDPSREPCLVVELGELRATIPLDRVPATFELPLGHGDRALLARVPAALAFVPAIAADDPIPNEIVDGSPSWTPREAYLDRAVAKLERALGLETPARSGLAAEASLDALARQFARWGRVPAVSDMFDVIGGVARADWLCRRAVAVQGLVGFLARAAGTQASRTTADAARAGALALREVAIWAGGRALSVDAAVADPVDALADPDGFRTRIHPLLSSLRAFALDVDGLLADWRRLRDRSDGPLAGELETLAVTAIARYAKFDPRRFETAAARRARLRDAATPIQQRSAS